METPNRSACSTAIIANTVVSRQSRRDLLKKMALLRSNNSNSRTNNTNSHREEENEAENPDARETPSECSSESSAKLSRRTNDMKKRSSFFDRLRVKANSSLSSRRRQGKIGMTRNEVPLPAKLVLIASQDCISLIPDSYSNSTGNSKEQTEEVLVSSNIEYYSKPSLFTFDLVPSASEESCEGTNTIYTNITTIQRNDNGLFILDQLKNSKNIDEKYKPSDNLNDTKPNDDATSKLELRSRTHSTELLSEASSQDPLPYERKLITSNMLLVGNPKSKMTNHIPDNVGSSDNADNKKSVFGDNKIQENASRCASFNIFSLFD